ncbi:DsbA family protein [Natrinema halophilum]|uniref:Thioredoxin domain-containing protein n=1 Tax=Natrinema halophilum TaxID=1699371 RepID=A0A7D5K563_9EURY|nr:thioredoxin domain-containing protein [Natrinema halophilum]QLG48103.1 DsbA family protein [Natrinema halophilum]
MKEETRLQRRTVLTATGTAALVGATGVATAQTASTVATAPIPDSPDAYAYPTMGVDDGETPTAIVYGNFKCPYTKGFVSGNFPAIIEEFVKTGRLKIQFYNLAYEPGTTSSYFISGSDPRCAAMGLGAWDEDPNSYWQFFAETFDDPPSGYVDYNELASRAQSAGVSNANEIADRVRSGKYHAEVEQVSAEAARDGVTYTPTLELAGDTTAPHHGTQAILTWIESRLNDEAVETTSTNTERTDDRSAAESGDTTDSDTQESGSNIDSDTPEPSGDTDSSTRETGSDTGSDTRESWGDTVSSDRDPNNTSNSMCESARSDENVIQTEMQNVNSSENGGAVWNDDGGSNDIWGVDEEC